MNKRKSRGAKFAEARFLHSVRLLLLLRIIALIRRNLLHSLIQYNNLFWKIRYV